MSKTGLYIFLITVPGSWVRVKSHMITCHLHLADQVHVFLLVLLCDQDVGSVGFQVPHFTHAKLLDLHPPQKRTYRRFILGF